jgi:hypothetical protein
MKILSDFDLWYRRLIICAAMGAVVNIILLFVVALLFAGANGNEWVKWYLGYKNGLFFMLGTALLAFLFFPLVRRLK